MAHNPKQPQSKIAKVQALLRRPNGASLNAICKATGWQPHSARAALSGLRKTGLTIERSNPDGKRNSVYRITATSEAAS